MSRQLKGHIKPHTSYCVSNSSLLASGEAANFLEPNIIFDVLDRTQLGLLPKFIYCDKLLQNDVWP